MWPAGCTTTSTALVESLLQVRVFYSPQDFALGSGGALYVVNNGSELSPVQGVTKCDLEHRLIWENRGPGYASGQSPWPKAIAVDGAENVYVADDWASQIFILDKDGNYLRSWGTKGSGAGELNAPSGLEFDRDDKRLRFRCP